MIEATIGTVDDAKAALRIHTSREDLPARVQARLADLAQRVNPVLSAHAKDRNALLRECALRDERGAFVWPTGRDGRPAVGTYLVDPAKHDVYEAALDRLRAQVVQFDWRPLDASELERDGSFPGGALALNDLRPFLDFSSYTEAEPCPSSDP